MKDSPTPPPAPDPTVTAGAQTTSNIDTALANARLNRVNQTTPWGSINYTQGPVDEHGVPTYSSNISLSPAQQQLLEQQQSQQLTRGNIASTLLGQVGNSLSKPLDLSSIHPMYDRYAPQGAATGVAPNAPARGISPTPQSAPGLGGKGAAMQPPNPMQGGNPAARGPGPGMPQQNPLMPQGGGGGGANSGPGVAALAAQLAALLKERS